MLLTIDQHYTGIYYYTIQCLNLGPSSARSVILMDRWPREFEYYADGIVASNGTTCAASGGDLTCWATRTNCDRANSVQQPTLVEHQSMWGGHQHRCGLFTNGHRSPNRIGRHYDPL
jgi:hypothetical protein